MNINTFFIAISIGLLAIFLGFKPLDIKEQAFDDVPLFQMKDFTLYELSSEGLVTLMKGSSAARYSDRYDVSDIDYTDNSEVYIANIVANKGLYRDRKEVLNLNGDVVYNREDGLMFETDALTYNKKTSIALTKVDYVLYQDKNRIKGNYLRYNNLKNIVKSKNIVATYQLKESKQ